jgi:hypothetical protein
MRKEQYWQDHPEYQDFYDFFEEIHMIDDKFEMMERPEDCDLVQAFSTCDDFDFLDGQCRIESEYCRNHEYLNCTSRGINEYGEEYEFDCTPQFFDGEWWAQMSEEQYWQDHPEYQDLYDYFDAYHSGDHHDDGECDKETIYTTCDEFEMVEGECEIYAEYCKDKEYFTCWIGSEEQEWKDCVADFLDAEFWGAMREEKFWEEHPEHDDFFHFWDV